MVRLEITQGNFVQTAPSVFTFQYGQIRNKNTAQIRKFYRLIYIPVWLDQKYFEQMNGIII